MSLEVIQKRLREEIKNSGISQKELAERIGVNPSTISKYMRINKFPALDTFANICKVLDVSSDYLLGIEK
jgi:transcriptional regulator with XRE-family HTH domain